MSADKRVAELEQLAREEGLMLPMPAEMIVRYERQGKVVDLMTGAVYDAITVQPTPAAKAVAYLLADVRNEFLV